MRLLMVILVVCVSVACSQKTKKIVVLDTDRRCPDASDLAVTLKNFTIKRVTRDIYAVDTTAKISRKISKRTSALVTLFRSTDRTESDSQNYLTVPLSNACRKLKEKDQAWSGLFEALTPKLECPVEPGDYVMKNGTLDLSKTAQLIDEEHFWRVRLEARDGFRPVMCHELTMYIQSVRN